MSNWKFSYLCDFFRTFALFQVQKNTPAFRVHRGWKKVDVEDKNKNNKNKNKNAENHSGFGQNGMG